MNRSKLWRHARHWRYKRPEITKRTPVHAAIRVRDGTVKLRFKRCFRIVREALAALEAKIRFRLIEYSVQNNHLHLIAEADDTYALSRAMRSLSIRIARRINQVMGARGVRITDPYFASVLATPLAVRMALRYVLNNYRRHAAQSKRRCPKGWVDPCSSGIWFDSWASPPWAGSDPCPDLPRGTRRPKTASLRHAWKLYGLLNPSEVPGPWRDSAAMTE
jgi:REP element-mobilizing transposase RayT